MSDEIQTTEEAAIARVEPPDTFTVLAEQARSRTNWELGGTAIGSSVTSIFVWLGHPRLHWLAAGFAATAAYALWGLADRASETRPYVDGIENDTDAVLLRMAKLVAVSGGVLAAFITIFVLMAEMWGVGWRH